MSTIWADMMGCQVHYVGNKFKTRVIEAGEGAPLIMIHGNGGHAEAYSRNIRRLAKHFHVMAIDLVWHGYSSKPPFNEAMVPTYCEQLLDLMEAKNLKKVNIEGESLGGWVGLWMALHYPDKLNSLILNTNAGVRFSDLKEEVKEAKNVPRERSLDALNNTTHEKIRKRLEWLMADPARVTDELVEVRYNIYSMEEVKKSLIPVVENSFGAGAGRAYQLSEDELKRINVPTQVIWSEKNPGMGPEFGRRIAEVIPNSHFYCIDDAGHWPQWEKAEEHDGVVIDFLLNKAKVYGENTVNK